MQVLQRLFFLSNEFLEIVRVVDREIKRKTELM
jgi:hypothetical protein